LVLRQLSDFPLKAEASPTAVDAASSPSIPHERAWREDGSRLAPELLSAMPASAVTPNEAVSFGGQRQQLRKPSESSEPAGGNGRRRRHSPLSSKSLNADPAARHQPTLQSEATGDDDCADDDFELAVASVTSYTRKSSRRPASAL
jgi:hypothetical protein